MGRAKHDMIEAQERGWRSSDKYICSNCLDLAFLAEKANNSACHSFVCSFCGSSNASSVNDLMPFIMYGVFSNYSDPSSAGVPREDGDWVGEDLFELTEWVLGHLGLEEPTEFVTELVSIIENDCWVRAPDGYFYGLNKHEYWQYSWQNFCELVKHKNRYFFHFVEGHDFDSEEMSPEAMLFTLQKATETLGLVKKDQSFDGVLFRARIKDDSWDICEAELRQPPNERAKAGRMNPAGISFFYAAEDVDTAVKEVCSSVAEVAVGKFTVQRSITFLDLTEIPLLHSVFDAAHQKERQYILFLKGFIQDITKPIAKDGKEHIDYVPTQIVSELFANQVKVDAIRFRSSINDGGVNWVLFPQAFDKLTYVNAQLVQTEITTQSTQTILDQFHKKTYHNGKL